MYHPISILIVEDTPAFVVKISRQLRRARLSFRARRIASKDAFVRELQCHRPDAILSNGGLPSFDGLTALAIAREKRPDVPFIFVTIAASKESATHTNGTGANHGALESPLSERGRALRRALREAKKRAKLRDAELMALTSRWLAR